MNVLVSGSVLARAWTGGEPLVGRTVADGLRRKGHTVTLAPHRRTRAELVALAATPRAWDPVAVARYRAELRRLRPEVVLSFYDYDCSMLAAGRLERIPVVVSSHIFWPVCPIGTLYIDGFGICPGASVSRCLRHMSTAVPDARLGVRLPFLPAPLGALAYSKYRSIHSALRSARTIVVPGERFRAILVASGLQRIQVVPNGLPAGEWTESPWAGGPKVVAFTAGSPIERKGVREFVAVARALTPRDSVTFEATNFPGEGPVVGHPYLPRAEAVEFVRRTYMVVLPSLWEEPFALAPLEAMAAGKPVVTYRVGGMPEIVDDGVTGFVVPLGDRAQLTARVAELIADEGRARAMGRAGRQRFERLFRVDAMIDGYERVLRGEVAAGS
ncbi:MAG TPA: glycosyltransferase family 4 protein [Thermoplasmata archaeon]|nr:glycosyltransferase family 4 protein [Thermoplasmata archaeon]